jgi:hypothetical protein
VKSDESASGSLSPFQLSANMLVNASHLTVSPFNTFAYPDLGRAVTGFFRLTHLNGLGGGAGGGTGAGGVRCIGNRLAEPKASCRAKACTSGVCCSECFGSIQECGDYKQANCPYGEDVFGVPVAFGKCCRAGRCTGPCCEECGGIDVCNCKRTAGIVPLGAVPWMCLMPGFPREWCQWVPGCTVDCWDDPTFIFFIYAQPAGWDRCYACVEKNCPCGGAAAPPPPPEERLPCVSDCDTCWECCENAFNRPMDICGRITAACAWLCLPWGAINPACEWCLDAAMRCWHAASESKNSCFSACIEGW